MLSRIFKVLYCMFCLCQLSVRWRRRRTFSFDRVQRVLILALNQGVGTITLLTPMLKSLKMNRPDLHVTLLTAPKVVAELLDGADYLDEIITEETLLGAGIVEGLAFVRREIGPRKFDLVISTFYDTSDKVFLWKLFCAPYRIGYSKGLSRLLDTFALSWQEQTHEVQRHLDILRFLGLEDLDESLCLPIGDQDHAFAEAYLASHGIAPNDLILGVHPGAKADWPEKRWPLERFVKVAEDFVAKYRGRVIFFGGPDDREEMEALSSLAGGYLLANNQMLKETAALIGRCTVFLCNDSGLMHLAAAMHVPVVAIFGPTRVTKNRPWRVPNALVRKELPCSPCYRYGRIKCTANHECMRLITVQDVSGELDSMLALVKPKVAAGER